MKNIKFSRLFAAFAFVACLALTACQQQAPETHKNIEGTWVSTFGEKWVITGSDLTNYYGTTVSYAGNEINVEESGSSGYIYVKYTKAYSTSDVGKWYALHYKDLNGNGVKISGAYKAGGQTSCATLEAAKAEFTVANGYYASYSECTKQ